MALAHTAPLCFRTGLQSFWAGRTSSRWLNARRLERPGLNGLLQGFAAPIFAELEGSPGAPRIQIEVLDVWDHPNAAALHDGRVLITAAAIEGAANSAVVAHRLGHEGAHIVQEDGLASILYGFPSERFEALVSSEDSEVVGCELEAQATRNAMDPDWHLFRRTQEQRADEHGARAAMKAGYPLFGMRQLLEASARAQNLLPGYDGLPDIYAPEARLKALERLAVRVDPGAGSLNEDALRELQAALR